MELPFNLDAEKQVLSNMIFSSDALVESLAKLAADDFYQKEHSIIFATIKEIFDENKAKIEASALIDRLSIDGNLEKVGDASYILELVDSFNDINNAKYYINTVAERSILRQLILNSKNVVDKWQQESAGDITSYINKVEKDTVNITKRRRVEDFVNISDAFKIYRDQVNDIREHGATKGVLTGYTTFDNLLLGFKPGELDILAARPSVGKSAFAINLLMRCAARTKKACVFFSLEMGVDTITTRMLAAKSAVPIRHIQTAKFTNDEEKALNMAMKDLAQTNLYFDETPAIKVAEMRNKLSKLQSMTGDIGLIVVDYIGLITPDVKNKKVDSRAIELGEISAGLKAIARDFKAPIIVLSQLNRAVEAGDSIPKLSNLRESGSIEQDADIVMFIHRDDYGKKQESVNNQENPTKKEQESDGPSDSLTKIIIAKNRNGALATIDFMFQKHIGRFVEVDPTLQGK